MINLQKYLPLGLSLSLNKFRSILVSMLLTGVVALIFSLLKLLSTHQLLWLYLLTLIMAIVLLSLSIHLYDKLNRKEEDLRKTVDDFNFVNKRIHEIMPSFNIEDEKEFNKGWNSYP